MKKALVLLSLSVGLPLSSIDHDGILRYDEKPITQVNILKLIGDIPGGVAVGMYRFLSKYPAESSYYENKLSPISAQNEYHIRKLMSPINLSEKKIDNYSSYGSDISETIEDNNHLVRVKKRDDSLSLEIMKVKNLSKNNYVFMCPGLNKWIIKVAGPKKRLNNLYASGGFNIYTKEAINPDSLNIDIRQRPTYQGISCAQATLALKGLIDNESFEHVGVPEVFLYNLLEKNISVYCGKYQPFYKEVNDSNCIVVQEFIPEMKIISKNKDMILDVDLITVEMAEELRSCIECARLWNIKNKLAICMDKDSSHYKKLVLFNIEQRDVTSIENFTAVSPREHAKIVKMGLRDAAELFESRPDLVAVFN